MGSTAKKIGGTASNLFNGSEKTYSKDALAGQVNALGKMGLDNLREGANELNKVYKNPQASITNQIGLENKLLRGATDDAARRTQSLIAQRGMGSSSIGLGQQINQGRALSDKLAMNNASGFERLMNLNKDRMSMGNMLFNPKHNQGPMQMNDITTRRGGVMGQGGLLERGMPIAQMLQSQGRSAASMMSGGM